MFASDFWQEPDDRHTRLTPNCLYVIGTFSLTLSLSRTHTLFIAHPNFLSTIIFPACPQCRARLVFWVKHMLTDMHGLNYQVSLLPLACNWDLFFLSKLGSHRKLAYRHSVFAYSIVLFQETRVPQWRRPRIRGLFWIGLGNWSRLLFLMSRFVSWICFKINCDSNPHMCGCVVFKRLVHMLSELDWCPVCLFSHLPYICIMSDAIRMHL